MNRHRQNAKGASMRAELDVALVPILTHPDCPPDQARRDLLPGEVRCTVCHLTAITPVVGQPRVCHDCGVALHTWNRKLYSSTPVIRGREYITKGGGPKR